MDEGRQEPRRERLEVPSTSRLERRLQVGDSQPTRPRNKPAIKPVPQSGLLGRLQSFLPALQAANTDLQQQLASQPASEVVMERGSDDEREGPVVELDLACGLFDLNNTAAVEAAERSLLAQGVAVETFDGGSSSTDSDSDSEGSSDRESEGDGEEGRNGSGGVAWLTEAAQQAQQQQQAALGGQVASDGPEAMQEDGPAAEEAGALHGGNANGQQQQQQENGAGPGSAGQRRKGRQRGKRHAGIVELP